MPYPGGSFWTLRYEFGCYPLATALGTLGLLRRGRGPWVGALLLAALAPALPCAALRWRLVERPCLALRGTGQKGTGQKGTGPKGTEAPAPP
jgi:peptidoglycan/LPS O-acetylase OafA/YrhL